MGYGPSRQFRDGGNFGEKIVNFKLADAERIASVVQTVERARRDNRGSVLPRATYESSHLLSRTSESWPKGTSRTLSVYSGEPGSESTGTGETIVAWNKFASVASGKWVMVARCNGTYYLISAEC